MRNFLFGDVRRQFGAVSAQDGLGYARTAALVGAAAAVGWLISIIPGVDFGQYGGIVTPVILFALDAARRWIGSQLPPEAQG